MERDPVVTGLLLEHLYFPYHERQGQKKRGCDRFCTESFKRREINKKENGGLGFKIQ